MNKNKQHDNMPVSYNWQTNCSIAASCIHDLFLRMWFLFFPKSRSQINRRHCSRSSATPLKSRSRPKVSKSSPEVSKSSLRVSKSSLHAKKKKQSPPFIINPFMQCHCCLLLRRPGSRPLSPLPFSSLFFCLLLFFHSFASVAALSPPSLFLPSAMARPSTTSTCASSGS